MLDNDNKIITYTIDKKGDRYGRSKWLNYIKKENMREKVLETTVTVLSVCLPFKFLFLHNSPFKKSATFSKI